MIEIVRANAENTQRQVWRFILRVSQQQWNPNPENTAQVGIVLDEYRNENRPSRRHGWREEDVYKRIGGGYRDMKPDEVPLPDDVRTEVLSKISLVFNTGS